MGRASGEQPRLEPAFMECAHGSGLARHGRQARLKRISVKIMLLVSSMHAGGAERVAATLANAWTLRGDSVTLVPTFSGKGTCFYPLVPGVDMVWLADSLGNSDRKSTRLNSSH